MGVSPLLKYGAFPSHRKKLSITRSEGAVKGKIHLLGTGRDRRALLFTSLLRARGRETCRASRVPVCVCDSSNMQPSLAHADMQHT